MRTPMLALLPVLLLAGVGHAADKAGCADPAWAKQRLPGFQISECQTRPWRAETLSLPKGEKTVEGQITVVVYELTDPSKNPTAEKARDFYEHQGVAAGAKLVSSPTDGWSAYLSKPEKGGEAWYLYDHGSGSSTSTGSYKLTTVVPVPFPQEVVARAMPGALELGSGDCKDPAWLEKAPTAFKLKDCVRKPWATDTYSLQKGDQHVEGRKLSVRYRLKDEDSSVYPLWLQRNFVNALTRAGAKLISPPQDASEALFRQTTPQGEFWFIYEQGGGNSDETNGFTLTTYQVIPLAQQVTARTMSGPIDPASPKCDGAPWIAGPYPGYKLKDCEARAWDRVSVSTASGDQVVEGKRLSVRYVYDSKQDAPVALAVTRNHVQALEKIGAKRVSKPEASSHAALTQTLPFGQVWYLYDQGGGNDEWVSGYSLTTLEPGPLEQEVVAQPVKGALDPKSCTPPWIAKQFSYFKQGRCQNRDFDQVELELAKETKKVAGMVLETTYTLSDPHRTPTALAVQLNFIRALQKIGATLMSNPDRAGRAIFKQTTPEGDLWYVYRQGSGNDEAVNSYTLMTIGPGSPVACKMEIYGLNFDFDKATLRPDSEPVLQALLAMFQRAPQAAGELGGHTDNVGKKAYNQKLSGERADAVKAWLVAHGIAASRLTTHGYGDSRPLVPNTTDENRAKNRRVELLRKNCGK